MDTTCSSKVLRESLTMEKSESKSSIYRGNGDMLSSLPDSLLHHIMSFMPAQQAVQLCVLSKRWKTLWTTLHVLNCELWYNQLGHSAFNRMVERFADFVSTVLLLREATFQLHTLTLDCDYLYVKLHDLIRTSIRPWIQYATKHNLQVLAINIRMKKRIILPSEVFTCPSLEHVTLSFTGRIDTPDLINLPSLKRLYLNEMKFDQDFMSKLLSGCPVLEDLHVEGGSVVIYKITSHSLKHLKIMRQYHGGSIELINSPNLLSFHFDTRSCIPKKGIILNMPSLNIACIEFPLCSYKVNMTKSNILCGLINVHHLELKGNLTQNSLGAEISNCITFSKLTYLSVDDICLNCRFGLISSLLEHCPNLKKLSLVHRGCICEKQYMTSKQKEVAQFKCEHLETIEVKFNMMGRTFDRVVKCLQEAVVDLPNCHIFITTHYYRMVYHDRTFKVIESVRHPSLKMND